MTVLTRRQFGWLVGVGSAGWLLTGCGPDQVTTGAAAPAGPGVAKAISVLGEQFGSVAERNRSPRANGADVNAVIAGLNEFSLDAYRALAAAPASNLVMGNYSLATALLLTTAAAGGDTRRRLAEMLHVADVDHPAVHGAANAVDLVLESRSGTEVTLATANKLFVTQGLPLRDEFLDIATGDYGAPVASVDFGAPQTVEDVNEWVADQTQGFITKLVESFDPNTVIALLNAVFLKAAWGVRFIAGSQQPFHAAGGDVVAPFIQHDEFLPLYQDPSGLVAVEIPYAGGNLAMLVIVPPDLAAFEAGFDPGQLATITAGLKESGVHFSMPKWAFETEVDGLALLGPLGLANAGGDFTGMLDGGDGLVISQIRHKARIEVDEQGTTAAAATEVAIAASHGPTVIVDRPFLFVIRDRGSATVLFVGRVGNPSES